MKTGVVMVGVILMVIGGLLAVTLFFPTVSVAGSTGISFLPMGGLLMAGVGFLTFIVGLAAPETERRPAQPRQKTYPPFYKPRQPQQPTPRQQATTETVKTVAICPQCKNRIPVTVKFCPECGEDLRPKKTS